MCRLAGAPRAQGAARIGMRTLRAAAGFGDIKYESCLYVTVAVAYPWSHGVAMGRAASLLASSRASEVMFGLFGMCAGRLEFLHSTNIYPVVRYT